MGPERKVRQRARRKTMSGVVGLRLMERGVDLPLIGRAEERAFLSEAITVLGGAIALAISDPLIAPDIDVRVRLRSLSPVEMCMAFGGRAGWVLALCDELDAAAARLGEELPAHRGCR